MDPFLRAQRTRFSLLVRVLLIALVTGLPPLILDATPPGWWYFRGVVDPTQAPNDYAAVNQGQVKFIAEQAAAELEDYCPGGAGEEITGMVAQWATPSSTTNDYAPINLGQLKTIAKPFHTRFQQLHYTDRYPWTGLETTANDYAIANIGQVKKLFSFDLSLPGAGLDSDNNGLPDWWEMQYFGHTGNNPNAPAPGGYGLTIQQAFQQGFNPNDYFNGQTPTLTVVSGTPQTGPSNGFVQLPLIVSAIHSNNTLWTNIPVTFTVGQTGGIVQASSSSPPGTSVTLMTDQNGQAQVYFKLPAVNNVNCTVTATTGSNHAASATFYEHADDGGGIHVSPFAPSTNAPSDVIGYRNADGSETVTWQNNTDDQTPVIIYQKQADGTWTAVTTLPPGTTSYTFPATQ